MGGVFKEVKKVAKRAVNPSIALRDSSETFGKALGKVTGGLQAGMGGLEEGQLTDEAALLEAEAQEDKRRKMLAEQSLTQTSPTGAGRPTTGRKTVTGV